MENFRIKGADLASLTFGKDAYKRKKQSSENTWEDWW